MHKYPGWTLSMRLVVALLVSLPACSAPVAPEQDGSTPSDASAIDAGRGSDAIIAADTSAVDASSADATSVDVPSVDAPTVDAAHVDAFSAVEVCDDGVDNDGNMLVDCADPACTSFACTAAPPAGWMGFGVLQSSPCTGIELTHGGVGVAWSDVTCDRSVCRCDNPPTNSTCRLVGYTGTDATCMTMAIAAFPSDGTCWRASMGSISTLYSQVLSGGTCTPTGAATVPIATAPAPGFTATDYVCAIPEGAGCGASTSCVASSTARCIVHDGSMGCPSAYPGRRLLARATQDMRTCSDCACGATGGSCAGTIATFGTTNCSGTALDHVAEPASSACTTLSAPAQSGHLEGGVVTGATCAVGGASPRGCVVPSNEVTVCCEGNPALPGCPTGGAPMIAPTGASYCIDQHEVTNAEYQAFLDTAPDPRTLTGICAGTTTLVPSTWPPSTAADFPVGSVSYCMAYAYCASLGESLCSGTQWQDACARGRSLNACYGGAIHAVESVPCCASAGVFDLVGNVQEWTSQTAGAGEYYVYGDSCGSGSPASVNDVDPGRGFRCCSPTR